MSTVKLEVIRNPIGTLLVDGEEKDTFALSFIIRKGSNFVNLTSYELDHIIDKAKPYYKKDTITE